MESLTLSDYNLQAGQSVTVYTTVRNVGTGVAAATEVEYFYWSRRENDWLKLRGFRSVASLRPRWSHSQSLTFPMAKNPVFGKHWLGACVREKANNNNCKRVAYYVSR